MSKLNKKFIKSNGDKSVVPAKSVAPAKSSVVPAKSVAPAKSSISVPVYKYKEIDFANAEVTEFNKDGTQFLAYINYRDDKLGENSKILVQSGLIKISSHGIPSLDKKGSKRTYYPDDSKREFIKIPLNDTSACNDLRKHLEAADEWAGSDEMRKKLFGKRANKYQYMPCIKTPQINDDDDDDSEGKDKGRDKNRPVIDFVKMKFNIILDGDNRINKTKLRKVDGKTKQIVVAETMKDVANEIRFLSDVKFIFFYGKIWANKTLNQGASHILYGIGLKIMNIEYTPGVGKSLNSAEIDFRSSSSEDDLDEKTNVKSKNKDLKDENTKSKPAFDDADETNNSDDGENQDKKINVKPKSKNREENDNKNKKSKSKPAADDIEENNNSDNGDDNNLDSKVTKKPKSEKKEGKNKKTNADSEGSDKEKESDKENEKINKKSKPKTKKKVESDNENNSDNENEEEDDIPIKKKSKKNSNKKRKVDDDDGEEEIKPKKTKK